MAKTAGSKPTLKSLADLASIVGGLSRTRRLLFRGQNVDRPLLPKIARIAEGKGIPYDKTVQIERMMLERFKKESIPLLRGLRPQNDWEWLSVAQHQGLPTRLLDWTANALAGLWFAVASDPTGDDDGVMWVLDVSPANEKSPGGNEDVFELRRTFVFQPFHIDQRIVAQAAWFSIHRYTHLHNKFLPLEDNARFKDSLKRYVVAAGTYARLRRELRHMGITQASMFPDMSGLCAEIQADCVGSWRSLPTI